MTTINGRLRIRKLAIRRISTTFKAVRLSKGLTRKEAARLCGVSYRAFEQIENGRCLMSPERVEKYLVRLGVSQTEYQDISQKAPALIKRLEREIRSRPKTPPKQRRNLYKIVTKEVRVIRILRQKKELTQYQAAECCGYANSIFGQIENGRIELPKERIEHLVRSLGYHMADFDRLMEAEVLRDEVLTECVSRMQHLDDQRLASVRTVIVSLGGA